MRTALACLLLVSWLAPGCSKKEEPAAVTPVADPGQPPSGGEPGKVVVKQVAHDGKVTDVDEETGQQIAEAVKQLAQDPAEGLAPEDRAASKDPAKIVGRWKILQLLYKTDGKAGEPSEPIVPTVWNFTADGKLLVEGGNELKLDYAFTGDKLIVTGFGPKLTYEIVKLTAKDLEVVAKISAGSTRFENSTVLTRADPQ